jgi:hypothetical protein
MTDFQYLQKGNELLLQITRQRRWLMNHRLSKLPADFTQKELNNIDYAKSIIRTRLAMKDYLERKKDSIAILISAVNRKYHSDLESLIKTQINK